jgi:hypothetical protein
MARLVIARTARTYQREIDQLQRLRQATLSDDKIPPKVATMVAERVSALIEAIRVAIKEAS